MGAAIHDRRQQARTLGRSAARVGAAYGKRADKHRQVYRRTAVRHEITGDRAYGIFQQPGILFAAGKCLIGSSAHILATAESILTEQPLISIAAE